MKSKTILITVILLLIITLIVIIVLSKRKRSKRLKNLIEQLDREKNIIETAPIPSELSKLETIIKNDKIEEKYNNWMERFDFAVFFCTSSVSTRPPFSATTAPPVISRLWT